MTDTTPAFADPVAAARAALDTFDAETNAQNVARGIERIALVQTYHAAREAAESAHADPEQAK